MRVASLPIILHATLVVVTHVLSLSGLAVAELVDVSSPGLVLQFDTADGRPVSLRNRSGEELLSSPKSSRGFFFASGDRATGTPRRLTHISKAGADCWLFQMEDRTESVTVQVTPGPEYLAFRIVKLEGVSNRSADRLFFELNTRAAQVRCLPLDYMTVDQGHAARILAVREALWEQSAANPLGGFAIYSPRDAAHEDEILLDIWTREKLPHPQINGEWTKEAARAWLDRWIEANADTSHLNIIGNSLDEVREAFPFAKRMDARAIYFWPGMWRGEYWLSRQRNDDVNPALFPAGRADLEALAKEARAQGLGLKLHYLSGNIGEQDPEFVEPHLSPELASWGDGTLAEPADSMSRELVVRVGPGVLMPESRADSDAEHPAPSLPNFFHFRTIRIGTEWVQADRVSAEGDGRYVLGGCRRGMWGTAVVAHPAGAPWRGYLRPYNQDFVPDNNSALLQTVADRWASLNNSIGCELANFDGLENHAYSGRWGGRKFATLVYKRLDHPVKATASNGQPPPCFLEYRFNRVRSMLGAFLGDDAGVSLFLADPSRSAPGLEEAEYQLSRAAFWNVRGFDLGSNDVKGVPIATLRDYGLRDDLLDLIRKWKGTAAALNADQRRSLNVFAPPDPRRKGFNGWHPRADRLWRLEGAQLHAWHALSDRRFTTDWHTGQEHGVVTPRFYAKTGHVLELGSEQAPPVYSPLLVIGRVLPAFEPEHEANIDLMPLLGEDSGTLQATNPSAEPRWIADVPRKPLPRELDLSKHRGLGLWVTGDSSNAAIVIQLHAGTTRDYVVPIDFTGRRWVEIPNGEVAWRLRDWGFRHGSEKSFRYDKVREISIGLGYLPAHANCHVQVEGLRALRESEPAIVDPVFSVNGISVKIRGSIPSGHHFILPSKGPCLTFDPNWKPGPTLACTGELHGPSRHAAFSFQASEPSVWLEAGVQKPGGFIPVDLSPPHPAD
ncbi:MAG: hypothetical protein NTY25_15495 [Planctomycetia bacterium]|nr:hypothetical protein [Planctomycetia bacterium]